MAITYSLDFVLRNVLQNRHLEIKKSGIPALLDEAQQMRHLGHDTTHRRRIPAFNYLVEFSETKTPHYLLMSFWRSYETPVILNPDLVCRTVFFCSLLRHKHLKARES